MTKTAPSFIIFTSQTFRFVNYEFVSSAQHLWRPFAVYQKKLISSPQITLAERRLCDCDFYSFIPLKPMLACLFDALLVSWPYCSCCPSFDNDNQNLTWPLLCIFTFIELHHMIQSGQKSHYIRHLLEATVNYLPLRGTLWKFQNLLSLQRAFCDPYYAFWTQRQRARKRFNLLTIATDLP